MGAAMSLLEKQRGFLGQVGEIPIKNPRITLQGTNISHQNGILKMIFLFPRWDMLISWRVWSFERPF